MERVVLAGGRATGANRPHRHIARRPPPVYVAAFLVFRGMNAGVIHQRHHSASSTATTHQPATADST